MWRERAENPHATDSRTLAVPDALPLAEPKQKILTGPLGFRVFMSEQVEQDGVTFAAEIQAMLATEVFVNRAGSISIKQVDAWDEEQLVTFPAELADRVIQLIKMARDAVQQGDGTY